MVTGIEDRGPGKVNRQVFNRFDAASIKTVGRSGAAIVLIQVSL